VFFVTGHTSFLSTHCDAKCAIITQPLIMSKNIYASDPLKSKEKKSHNSMFRVAKHTNSGSHQIKPLALFLYTCLCVAQKTGSVVKTSLSSQDMIRI
jgi:hypothetical protein